jgi:galactokinase
MPTTVRWRAPGRVNLIGEHTDYNDGFALPFAIEQTCTAGVAILAEPGLRVTSAQQEDPVEIAPDALDPGAPWLAASTRWASYALGVIWALRHVERAPSPLPGLLIEIDGGVPLGAGLSSSAAMSCSVAAAVNDLLGLGLTRPELAAVANQAENDFVGAPTGGMDQLASLLAVEGHVLLCDMRSRETSAVPLDLASPGLALLIVDTHAPHRHADGEYAERRRSCELAAAELGVPALRDATVADLDQLSSDLLRRRVRHVVTEDDRVLDTVARLRAGDVAAIGPILTASHRSMRDDFEITVPEVDVAVDALLQAGALGARMTGGGFGGCVLALLAAGDIERAAKAVLAAYETHGFAAPSWFVTAPSRGAYPARS